MTIATSFDLIKKHISVTSCEDIHSLMMPLLAPHGIKVFNYYRRYNDGSVIRLSTDRAWTEHFFKKNYLKTMTSPSSCLTKPLSYFIWLVDDCPEMLLDAAINFDTSNGITFAMKQDDYVEYFGFGSTTANRRIINNYYLNNLDELEQYCYFFKEKASAFLALGDKDRITVSSPKECLDTFVNPSVVKLSARQMDCINLLVKGMTCKQIGATLNLSPRTVEMHLQLIKNKTGCLNNKELIAWFMQQVKNWF